MAEELKKAKRKTDPIISCFVR